MSQIAKVALDTARALLNDEGVQLWTDAILRNKLAVAHRELQVQLRANACPVTRTSVILTVNPGEMTVTNPTDIIEPVVLWEKDVGAPDSEFERMTEYDPLPIKSISDRLIYWRWAEEAIQFLGSTAARDVKIIYKRMLAIPAVPSDSIGIIDGESFLGPRIAALAFGSTGNTQAADWCTNMAVATLTDILNANRGRSRQVPRS